MATTPEEGSAVGLSVGLWVLGFYVCCCTTCCGCVYFRWKMVKRTKSAKVTSLEGTGLTSKKKAQPSKGTKESGRKAMHNEDLWAEEVSREPSSSENIEELVYKMNREDSWDFQSELSGEQPQQKGPRLAGRAGEAESEPAFVVSPDARRRLHKRLEKNKSADSDNLPGMAQLGEHGISVYDDSWEEEKRRQRQMESPPQVAEYRADRAYKPNFKMDMMTNLGVF